MIVEPRLIETFLPARRPEISVKYQNGQPAFKARTHELLVLAGRGYIEGVIYKGELSYCRLLVSVRAAMRLLSPLQVQASDYITKKRQAKGAPKWVVRLDRADSGTAGASRRLWFRSAVGA